MEKSPQADKPRGGSERRRDVGAILPEPERCVMPDMEIFSQETQRQEWCELSFKPNRADKSIHGYSPRCPGGPAFLPYHCKREVCVTDCAATSKACASTPDLRHNGSS